MKTITPYLFFPGECEEALNYYAKCLNGEISAVQRFGDAEMPVDDHYKDKIMHAEFKADDIHFMASDGPPHKKIEHGNNVHLSINLDDPGLQKQIFDRLADGGTVTMDLQDTFWGARYGMLIDKYGIHWMLNCELRED